MQNLMFEEATGNADWVNWMKQLILFTLFFHESRLNINLFRTYRNHFLSKLFKVNNAAKYDQLLLLQKIWRKSNKTVLVETVRDNFVDRKGSELEMCHECGRKQGITGKLSRVLCFVPNIIDINSCRFTHVKVILLYQ